MKEREHNGGLSIATLKEKNPYETEKNLRVFGELSSEALSTLLATHVAKIEEALSSNRNEEKDEALRGGLQTLDQALFISRNLRYFFRKIKITHRITDLSQEVLNTLDSLDEECRQKGIELGAFVESGIYSRIDSGTLEQILSNLLIHSISAIPHGGKLTVALAKNSSQLEFCISNTGKGLKQEQLEHLFEPYFATHTEAFHSKDRGLGLIVAKTLIESEGGELTVRSILGKGTNFFFTLPHDPKISKPEVYVQKRRFDRIHLQLPIEVTLPTFPSFTTRLTALSTGGCFIELPPSIPPPPKHSPLQITLLWLGTHPLLIENARVANTASTDAGTGLGIEFVKLNEKAFKILTAIVKGHR